MAFTRTIEDFDCEKCGVHVAGSGYTNHCPDCLWSKHVDREPGDRAAECGGMMKPVSVEGSSPDYIIVHECTVCGFRRRNKVAPADSIDVLLALSERPET